MLAVVDIPALPLQRLLQAHDDWKNDPVVVVEADKPLASILWANRHARQHRIVPGMRFAAARALNARLRAGVVPQEELDDACEALFRGLLQHSPRVEPASGWPGLFWLDPSGLEDLYGSLDNWAAGVHRDLVRWGYCASVVVGFDRYAIFALARTTTGPHVVRDRRREAQWARRVPLARLNISPKLLGQLSLLGIDTLGAFLRLPEGELGLRYGDEALALHRLAAGKAWAPLMPKAVRDAVCVAWQLETPEAQDERLLFGLKGVLRGVVEALTQRCEAITALSLTFHLDQAGVHAERIETAGPTLNIPQLTDLMRLRLNAMKLGAPVKQIDVLAESVAVQPQQLALMQAKRRDLAAVARAFARIKALFGSEAVVRAVLKDAVLPEARFAWEPLQHCQDPACQSPGLEGATARYLARRFFCSPLRLPDIPNAEPERWLGAHGAVAQMQGPYRISGGWWSRRVVRDYYYVETKTGVLLWLYHDGVRQRWMLHGVVD